jgi:hypothetical protein
MLPLHMQSVDLVRPEGVEIDVVVRHQAGVFLLVALREFRFEVTEGGAGGAVKRRGVSVV